MLHFKVIVAFLILTLSCTQNIDSKITNPEKKKSETNSLQNKELVPYTDIYQYDQPYDSVFPNGSYLKYFVNKDSTDPNLYLKYGTQQFDSIYILDHWLELSPCHRYKICYSTEKSIGLVYQCANSKGMVIIPLERSRKIIQSLNPLYIGSEEGLTISLIEDDNNFENGDRLLIADLDFKKKQYIDIKTLVCGDRIKCFDNVKVKGTKLLLTYTGAIKNSDPQIINQVETILLKDIP